MTIKKCAVCRREFETYRKPKRGGRRHKLGMKSSSSYKRRYGCVTCSKECSKEYERTRYERNKYKDKKMDNFYKVLIIISSAGLMVHFGIPQKAVAMAFLILGLGMYAIDFVKDRKKKEVGK